MRNHRDFKVFQSATGLGLKAMRNFEVEDELVEYTGPHISTAEANERPNRYLFQLNEELFIDGSSRANLARYINHSCRPNAQAFLSHDERRVTIEAIKPIKKGDEIVIDYGKEYFDAYIAPIGCRCVKCRPGTE